MRRRKPYWIAGAFLIAVGLAVFITRIQGGKSQAPAVRSDSILESARQPSSVEQAISNSKAVVQVPEANKKNTSENQELWNRPSGFGRSNVPVSQLVLGDEIPYSEPGWRAVKNVIALREDERKLAESLGKVIGSHGPFLLVRVRESGLHRSPEMKGVVYHSDHRKVGILSGTLVVHLSDVNAVARIASDHQLGVVHIQESIQTAFLVALDSDPVGKLKNLKDDKRIVSADVDIRSTFFERH